MSTKTDIFLRDFGDWFDSVPERMEPLINPEIPVGIATVKWSSGNHNIIGDVVCPKILVFPWELSTIEPDTKISTL